MKPIQAPKLVHYSSALYSAACVILLLAVPFFFQEFSVRLIPLALLALFIPGASLVRLMPETSWLASRASKIGWSILISFLLFSSSLFVILIMKGGQLVLTWHLLFAIVIALSLATSVGTSLLKPLQLPQPISGKDLVSLVAPALLTLLGTFLPLLINPYAQDNDGFLGKTISYATGSPVSLHDLRPLFPATLAAASLLTNGPVLRIFLYLPIIIFLAGVACFWGYVSSEIQSYSFKLAAFATVFSAPIIALEVITTRPQVILLAYTIPLLILAIQAFRKHSLYYAGTGVLLSVLLMPFHELGAFYLLFFLLLAVRLLWGSLRRKTLSPKNVLLAIVIAAPYFLILPFGTVFHQVVGVLQFATQNVHGLEWRWWFVNSYTSVDGAQLGWPGIQAFYYYLYNGLLLYIALIGATLLARRKSGKASRGDWSIPLLFLSFFFFFAEIAPRLGFYFLLNRTWPYIGLAACVYGVTFFQALEKTTGKIRSLILVSSALLALSGLIGIVFVAKNNVVEVFPEERGGIDYLSHVPANSLVLSNQNNGALVRIYTGKAFFAIAPQDSTTPASLNAFTSLLRQQLTTATIETISFETTITTSDGSETSRTTGPEQITKSTAPLGTPPPGPIYYYFSKRKASGLNGQRSALYYGDTQAGQPLPIMSNYTKVFEDGGSVIYKLSGE